MKIVVTLFVIFAVFLAFPPAVAGPILRVEGHTPQVVLQLDHVRPNGVWVVVPRGTVVFSVQPTSGAAPLAPGDYLICHMHDVLVEGHKAVSFKCGEIEYQLMGLDVVQEKDNGK